MESKLLSEFVSDSVHVKGIPNSVGFRQIQLEEFKTKLENGEYW